MTESHLGTSRNLSPDHEWPDGDPGMALDDEAFAVADEHMKGYDEAVAEIVEWLNGYANDLRGDRRFDDFKARDARAVKHAADEIARTFGQVPR